MTKTVLSGDGARCLDGFHGSKWHRLRATFTKAKPSTHHRRLLARRRLRRVGAHAVAAYAQYIPGHPTILVENMTGAGSLLAANHIFKVAKPRRSHLRPFQRRVRLQSIDGATGSRIRYAKVCLCRRRGAR